MTPGTGASRHTLATSRGLLRAWPKPVAAAPRLGGALKDVILIQRASLSMVYSTVKHVRMDALRVLSSKMRMDACVKFED